MLLAVVLLVAAAALPLASASDNVVFYMDGASSTVNNVTGFLLTNETVTTAQSVTLTSAGSVDVTFSVAFWLTHINNQTTSLGASTIFAARAIDGVGIQTATFNAPSSAMAIGYDALKAVVYVQFGAGAASAIAVFTSDQLLYKTMNAVTWTINLYTNRTVSGGSTYATFNWGDSTHVSDITGMSFVDANIYEVTLNYYGKGNLVMGILYPYIAVFGTLFWGIVVFIVAAPLYIRTRNVGTFVFLMSIFGGGSGMIWALIPAPYGLAVWFIFALGLTVVLYRLVR